MMQVRTIFKPLDAAANEFRIARWLAAL